MENLLLSYFKFFSIKLSGDFCKTTNEIEKFLSLISKKQDLKSLGEWFAWWYVAFQFEYYASLKTQMQGKFPANWIFGPKALKRWEERSEKLWLYHVQQFLDKYSIVKPQEYFSSDLEGQFEEERKRFFNTEYGFFHCQQFSKFSEKSPSCLICKSKKDCRKLWM